MSEFDKEAERRRLREKYESEREDRETTERMSELLLQGATMTNKHCDTCGNPIFRYQGQEFCPTCQAEAQERADASSAGGSAPETTEEPAATVTEEPTATTEPTPERAPADSAREPPVARSELTPDVPAPGTTDVDEAAAALTAAVATLAGRAEATDDPRRATEFLEAAREAAEALAALRD